MNTTTQSNEATQNEFILRDPQEFKWLPNNPTTEMISSINDDLMRGQFIEGYKRLWNSASSDLLTIFQVVRTG
jgi:hypothetical protein